MTFFRAIVFACGALFSLIAANAATAAPQLVFSLLPSSRSVDVGTKATAFLSIINAGDKLATDVAISLSSAVPATLDFQTTDPKTNALTGAPNVPVDIPAGGVQTFIIVITPTAAIPSQELLLKISGTNATAVSATVGVDTLLFSATSHPPDIVALAATLTNDGIVSINPPAGGVAAFAVATVNVGNAGSITASADTGNAALPLAVSICQTNPTSGQCLAPPGPTVTTNIPAGSTPTFGIFLTSNGDIPFLPGQNRIFVRFKDGSNISRGATSVAVRTTGNGVLQVAAVSSEDNQTPVPGTYTVLINGIVVGQTQANGTFSSSKPAQAASVRLIGALGIGGTGTVTVPTNGVAVLNVPVSAEGSVLNTGLAITPLTGGVMQSNLSSLVLSVPGVALSTVVDIYLQSQDLKSVKSVTSLFAPQPNGTIVASNLPNIVSLIGSLASLGILEFEVHGSDSTGLNYVATGQFNWGNVALSGQLKPPSSNPSLSVANVTVIASMGTRGVQLTAVTDSSGKFSFPFVPEGTVTLSAATASGGSSYTASGGFTVTGNTTVTITLQGVADLTSPAAPVAVTSAGDNSSTQKAATPEREQAHAQAQSKQIVSAAGPNSATATAGAKDVTVKGSVPCSLTPQSAGKPKTFTYVVQTAEYPFYVQQQSQFNDQWSVSAYTTLGQQLFTTGQVGVNSQLYVTPIWKSDGTTGVISVTISLPANATTLLLVVTSVNIGDSALATTVTANCPLDTSLQFSAEDVEDADKGTVKNISLPRPESTQALFPKNTRHAILKYSPTDLTIDLQSLKLMLVQDDGGTVQVSPVQATVESPGTLRVQTTFGDGNGTSPFAGLSAPNTKYTIYRVQVNATGPSGTVQLGPADSKPLGALWRANEIDVAAGTYGAPQPLDGWNWATLCTFNWMKSNLSVLRPLNDISAHHGRPFAHPSSHTRGRHFDMFHIYQNSALADPTPNKSGSGSQYYTNLHANATTVADPNASASAKQAAKTILRSWALASRTGIDALLKAGASQVLYVMGAPSATLKSGWGGVILRDGKMPDGVVDTTLGTWTPAGNFKPDAAHNDHLHVDLSQIQTANGCDGSRYP